MSNNEFPSDYSSGEKNDTNIHTAPNENLSETSLSPTVPTQVTQHTTSTQLLTTETSKRELCPLVDGYSYTKHRMTQDVTQMSLKPIELRLE